MYIFQSLVFLINIVRDLMFSWQDSTPRIVKFRDNPGGPCGGTHVADISVINSLKVIIIIFMPR
jgi:Ser-tRNA(Ala) deacylase AlaX